jgi:hypothetical protein
MWKESRVRKSFLPVCSLYITMTPTASSTLVTHYPVEIHHQQLCVLRLCLPLNIHISRYCTCTRMNNGELNCLRISTRHVFATTNPLHVPLRKLFQKCVVCTKLYIYVFINRKC